MIATLFLFRSLFSGPPWHFPLCFSSRDSAESLPPRDNVDMPPPTCFYLWSSFLLDFVCSSLIVPTHKRAGWISQSTLTSTSALTPSSSCVIYHLWTLKWTPQCKSGPEGHEFFRRPWFFQKGMSLVTLINFLHFSKTSIYLSAIIGHS